MFKWQKMQWDSGNPKILACSRNNHGITTQGFINLSDNRLSCVRQHRCMQNNWAQLRNVCIEIRLKYSNRAVCSLNYFFYLLLLGRQHCRCIQGVIKTSKEVTLTHWCTANHNNKWSVNISIFQIWWWLLAACRLFRPLIVLGKRNTDES